MLETKGHTTAERDALLKTIRQRLAQAQVSDRSLSVAIGRNPGWLSGIFTRGGLPNALDLYKIAKFFGCRMEEFFDGSIDGIDIPLSDKLRNRLNSVRNERGFSRPTIPEAMTWFLEQKGRLTNDEMLRDYYDVFGKPDVENMRPNVLKIGPRSLVAVELNLTTTQDLSNFVTACDEEIRQQVVRSHVKVLNTRKPDIQPKSIAINIDGGLNLNVSYIRLLLPVKTDDDEMVILNYAYPTQVQEVIVDEMDGLVSAESPQTIRYL